MQVKRWIILILCAISAVSYPSCNEREEQDGMVVNPSSDEHTGPVRPAFEVVGTYKGLLPCASCPGIESTVIFSSDGKVQKTDLYTDKDENSFSSSGFWQMETPERIKVAYGDNTEYYLLLSATTIELLNAQKEWAPAESHLDYTLKKERSIKEPSKLNGTYVQQMDGGYVQTLEIKEESSGAFRVTITSDPATQTECSFSGEGQFVNNRIEVSLGRLESSLKGTMTIDVAEDTARIFTTVEAQRYDLMFFCSGGTSLAGSYLKQ